MQRLHEGLPHVSKEKRLGVDAVSGAEQGLPRVSDVEVRFSFPVLSFPPRLGTRTKELFGRGLMERDDWHNLGLDNVANDKSNAKSAPSSTTASTARSSSESGRKPS